ncbi:MAG TPA: energy transducer TonB [Bryobacteraceae bacterium]|nr:energy transducer TonB [Bryobacteraceae bacterium]
MKLQKKHLIAAVLACAIAQVAASADSQKHLSIQESIAAATNKPQPQYPAMAKQMKLEGAVNLNAYVTEEGVVERVEPVSGNPILVRSAQDALLHWKFTKQTEDGKPVKFVATITFNFKQ